MGSGEAALYGGQLVPDTEPGPYLLPDPADLRAPRRLWRRRTRGSRLPEGAVCVDRTSKAYGNPFTVADILAAGRAADAVEAAEVAVSDFHAWLTVPDSATRWPDLEERRAALLAALPALTGKDLACFCAPGRGCHADVLLWMANQGPRPQPRELWPMVSIGADVLAWCGKPDCDRLVPQSVVHCCPACATAAAGRYEIDQHSGGCDSRWEQRRARLPRYLTTAAPTSSWRT